MPGHSRDQLAQYCKPHALVLHAAAGLEIRLDRATACHKLLQARPRLTQLTVLRQHVGQPRRVSQQVTNTDSIFATVAELREIPAHTIVQPHLAILDKDHRRHRHDRLGDRRDQKNGVIADGPMRVIQVLPTEQHRAGGPIAPRQENSNRGDRSGFAKLLGQFTHPVPATWVQSGRCGVTNLEHAADCRLIRRGRQARRQIYRTRALKVITPPTPPGSGSSNSKTSTRLPCSLSSTVIRPPRDFSGGVFSSSSVKPSVALSSI